MREASYGSVTTDKIYYSRLTEQTSRNGTNPKILKHRKRIKYQNFDAKLPPQSNKIGTVMNHPWFRILP